MKTWITDTAIKIGEHVDLFGWVGVRRDHGKLIFIDLRDRSGLVQVVFTPQAGEAVYEAAKQLRAEWIVHIKGLVKERPQNLKNADMVTGAIEIEANNLEILSQAQTPPFDVMSDGREIGEEIRMQKRYVDLRRARLQGNLLLRHRVIKSIRDFLSDQDFVEVETPILTKSTPEGARDYVVPSRLQQGSFYALPQSPQQYKQLLMSGGVERYFQIARCFRDEDTRGDRQPEFTQFDMEMSFVNREDVMALNEELLIHIVKTQMPEKRIQQIPFPQMTFAQAMEQYGTDRPDVREDKDDPNLLAFVWIVDFPFFERIEDKDKNHYHPGKEWTFTHNPFSAPQEKDVQKLLNWQALDKKEIASILTTQYDVVLNGWEIGGGSIRSHDRRMLEAVFGIMGQDDTSSFEHMFEAFDLGTPPHGGIAWGLDRLIMILANEPNIREVMAFPKTGDGRDLMMRAPSELDGKQLDELGITIKKEEK